MRAFGPSGRRSPDLPVGPAEFRYSPTSHRPGKMTSSSRTRAGIPSFEAKLEHEEEVLDSILSALAKNALDPSIWQELHEAAVRHDRVSELAFAYESAASSRKLKTFL